MGTMDLMGQISPDGGASSGQAPLARRVWVD